MVSDITVEEVTLGDPQSRIAQVVDQRYLLNVLIHLNVGIRKLSLYHASHPVIPEIISGILNEFNTIFEFADTILLTVAKDEIIYQGSPIAKNHPVVRELGRLLHQLNLIGVTLRKGLSQDDLLRFLVLISSSRALSQSEREKRIAQFHQEVSSIVLHLISFKGAIRPNENDLGDPTQKGETNASTHGIWQGLAQQLINGQEEGEIRGAVESDSVVDPNRIAEIINSLSQNKGRKGGDESYEKVIVRYLRDHANREALGDERRVQMNRELGILLSNLRPDVRDQIFKFSLEEDEKSGNDKIPLEDLVEVIPPPMLLEALNRIQLSQSSVSNPMFSLLKKFVTLSESNEGIKGALEAKVQSHPGLLEELFTNRADRKYYPTAYRSLLDEGFSLDETAQSTWAKIGRREIENAETDLHFGYILLEILEGEVRSPDHYSGAVDRMKQLLDGGIGPEGKDLLHDTLRLLVKRVNAGSHEDRVFMLGEIKKLFTTDAITQLLKASTEMGQEGEENLLNVLMEMIGRENIDVLLDLLEEEENLSTRKRILGMIVECGEKVVPAIVNRLQSQRWYVVRNMLVLLKDLQVTNAVHSILPCMEHESSKVRLGALQALEKLAPDSKDFLKLLEGTLKDEDPKVMKVGTLLLVSKRQPSAGERIQERLSADDVGGETISQKLVILKAIGEVGNRDWIPFLQKLRNRLILQFWRWPRERVLRRAVREALSKIHHRAMN